MWLARHIALAGICASLLVCPSLLASSSADISLHDAGRNRNVPLKIYFPDDTSSPHPLIVFSHGYCGTKDGYSYLGRAWADAGYVVVLPMHVGSDHEALKKNHLIGPTAASLRDGVNQH